MTLVERVFDRRPQFDTRSRAFAVADLTVEGEAETRLWRVPKVLDQGAEGACVGFAVVHELIAFPVPLVLFDADDALALYEAAQTVDEWPGEDYEGTSVLAGIKVAKSLGYYEEYRWAFGVDDLAAAVSQIGPAVLGINWWSGMASPADDGYVEPTGVVTGGHAILCSGWDADMRAFRLHNSWGPLWGENGECWVSYDDMEALLADDGEACIPLVRAWGRNRLIAREAA